MIRSTYSYMRHYPNSRESVHETIYDPFRDRVFPRPQQFSFNSEYYQHSNFRRNQLCRHRRGCSVLKYTSKWRIAREKNAFEEDERMVHNMPSWKKYASYEEDQKFYGDMAQQIKSLTNDGEINRFEEEEEDIFSRQVKEYIYELSPERKVSKFNTNFNDNHSSNISTLYNIKTNQNPRSSEYEDSSNNDQRSDYNYRETIRDRVKNGSKRNLYEKHNQGLKPRYKMENIFNENYKLSQREGAKTRWNEDSSTIWKLERNEKSISREHASRTMNENINNSHCSYKNTKTQHHSHYGVTTPRYYNKGMDRSSRNRYESNYSVRDGWQNETRDLQREYRAAESNGSRETLRSPYRELTKRREKHLKRYRDEASVDYENTREETYHYKEGKDSRETEKFRPKEIENMSNKIICRRGRRPMKEEEKPSSEWKNKRPICEIKKCHGMKHHSREMINYKSNQEKESKWRDKHQDKNHETQIRCPEIRKIETHNKIGSVYLDEDTNNIRKELHETLRHRVNIRSYSSVGSKIQDLRIRSHTSVGRGSRNNIISRFNETSRSRSRRNARSSSYERTDNKPLRNERNYNTIETTSSSKIGSTNKSDKWGSRENKKWSSKESVKRRSSERGKRWSSESSENSPSKRGKRWSSESSPSERGKSSPSERGKSSPSERGKSSPSESSLSGRSSSERTKSGSRGRGSCSDEESSSSASVKSKSRDRIRSSQGKPKNKYHCARRELREKYGKSCQRKTRKDKTKNYCREKKNALQDNKIMSCNVIKSTCLNHVLEINDDKIKSPCDGRTDKLCSKVRRGFHHSQGQSTRGGFDDKKNTPDKIMTSKACNTTQISVHCRTTVLGRDKK